MLRFVFFFPFQSPPTQPAILVRIFIAVVQCRRHTKKTSISKGAKCVKGTLVAVLILNLALATCVFVFTQTKRHVNGELVFSVPENVIDDKYDDLRYFEVQYSLPLS